MKLTKFFKTGITQVIILLLGLTILLTMGFNKGFDFTGGSILTINCQTYTQVEAENKVKTVLADYPNAKIYTVQHGNLYDDKTITIKLQFKDNASETTENIISDLFTTFNYDKDDVIEKGYINSTTNTGGAFTNAVLTNALLGAMIALIAVAIYVFARFGLTNAFSLMAGTLLDITVFLAIISIFRIEINAYLGFAVLVMTIISMLLNFLILSNLSKNSYEEKFKKSSNKEVANATASEKAKQIMTYASSIIVALLICAIVVPSGISGELFSVALATALGITTTLFITPTLWSFAFVRKTKQPKQKVQVEVESEE